jgi:hypothetical protein
MYFSTRRHGFPPLCFILIFPYLPDKSSFPVAGFRQNSGSGLPFHPNHHRPPGRERDFQGKTAGGILFCGFSVHPPSLGIEDSGFHPQGSRVGRFFKSKTRFFSLQD